MLATSIPLLWADVGMECFHGDILRSNTDNFINPTMGSLFKQLVHTQQHNNMQTTKYTRELDGIKSTNNDVKSINNVDYL